MGHPTFAEFVQKEDVVSFHDSFPYFEEAVKSDSAVDVFATYDSFSVHLLASLEGFGFCKEGEGGAFVQNGRIEIGGELPCNTSGGMLSESYMQSWNHQPELVRQLRGGLGQRQVQGAEVAQYVHDVAGKCKSIVYTKGG